MQVSVYLLFFNWNTLICLFSEISGDFGALIEMLGDNLPDCPRLFPDENFKEEVVRIKFMVYMAFVHFYSGDTSFDENIEYDDFETHVEADDNEPLEENEEYLSAEYSSENVVKRKRKDF
jgi:hypothetical protein